VSLSATVKAFKDMVLGSEPYGPVKELPRQVLSRFAVLRMLVAPPRLWLAAPQRQPTTPQNDKNSADQQGAEQQQCKRHGRKVGHRSTLHP
jgi:hypothetical protein